MTTPYHKAGTSPIVLQGQQVVSVVDAIRQARGGTKRVDNAIATSGGNTALLPPKGSQNGGAGLWIGGEQQPRRCRDGFWALLFYVHLGAIAAATIKFAPVMTKEMAESYGSYGQGRRNLVSALQQVRWLSESMQENYYQAQNGNQQQEADWDQDEEINIDMTTLLIVLSLAGAASLVLSTVALAFMMKFAKGLIKTALWFNIIVTGATAIFALAGGIFPLAILCGLGCLISAYYAYCVWPRIPFAASNLVTAVTAVRANLGVTLFAFANLVVNFLWSIWWSLAVVATAYVLNKCEEEGNCNEASSGIVVFLFVISFYWTTQVVKNVVHVTVAGTVGTWWLAPQEASNCCSQGVRDSYVRSVTTSFGSICLGSLIVAIIQALKELVQAFRESAEDSMLMCCLHCLLGCIESLVEYFNQWAFVYVGLYGHTFMEAGMNVMALFRNRGWTAIIADVLVDTVLLMVSLGVGVLTGLVGVASGVGMVNLGEGDLGGEATLLLAFIGGFLIGFVMCSTLFTVISSAVNAVIVCFAEAPSEFQANHPQLSQDMQESWRQAYPVEFH